MCQRKTLPDHILDELAEFRHQLSLGHPLAEVEREFSARWEGVYGKKGRRFLIAVVGIATTQERNPDQVDEQLVQVVVGGEAGDPVSERTERGVSEPNSSSAPGGTMTDLLAVIRQGVRAVPSVKYAVGVAALAAVVALVSGWGIDLRVALAGIIALFILMAVLVVFAALSRLRNPHLTAAAIVVMWVAVVFFVVWAGLLTAAVFFNYPKPAAELFGASKT